MKNLLFSHKFSLLPAKDREEFPLKINKDRFVCCYKQDEDHVLANTLYRVYEVEYDYISVEQDIKSDLNVYFLKLMQFLRR